jgi:N-acetyl-gamma-glutamyl-phosphate reductase
MSQISVGIINVSGYAGAETARLLYRHPGVQLVSVTGRSAVGQKLGQFFPHLAEIDLDIEPSLSHVDLAFSAMPHKASAEVILPLLEKGVRVVDISADFRLKDAALYPRWYDFSHPAPELLGEAVYGQPELRRSEIKSARLVANPGCYATGVILPLAPAVKEDLIEPDIIVDAKSGVSGAGRTPTITTHYSEVNESVSAYALDGHRHLPEMIQELEGQKPGRSLSVTFVPHLVPMTRGILSTCYSRLVKNVGRKEVAELYREFYQDEPFVRVANSPPQTKQVLGSNLCFLYPTVDVENQRLIAISCIDNLVKGAAGQAIQNMNLMLGFPETMGLEELPIYP